MADWPILQEGATGSEVRTLQYLLGAWQELAADAIFGPETKRVVQEFQRLKGLAQDGIVGARTWSALTDGSAPIHSTVAEGDTGSVVTGLQYELNKFGYDLEVDGNFGPKTKAAVEAFQERAGVTVDGIVGPNTWRELITHYDI